MPATRRTALAALGAAATAAVLRRPASAQQPAPLRKPIPSSGETIPIVGLGSARRYEEARTEADLAPLRDTFRRFHALGGTVLDTAPSYGDAEAIMGGLMADLGLRPALFVATKVGARSREDGHAQIERSFRSLRTDRIDLVAVHNLLDTANQLAALRDLKAGGRVRYVGATTSFDRQYGEFEAMMRREALDSIQVDYALDNRGSADRIIPLARDRGMAVFVNLPFGRGRLFEATRGRPLPEWAAEFDCATWAQFFLKYIVSHEAVTCAIPGMAQVRYVDDNLGAARGRLPDAATRLRMERFIDGL